MTGQKAETKVAKPGVPWKTVALPIEHGGWSFLLEPVVLGLALSPSRAGACLALAALAAFLTRHPLRLAVMDYRKGARYPRTRLAERFVLAYGLMAFALAVQALALAVRPVLPVIGAAAPFALLAMALDLAGRGRAAVAELAGSVALAASVCAIILAGGGRPEVAWLVWGLQSLRAITAILYVRARLRHERGGDPRTGPVMVAHALALILVTGLVLSGRAPYLAAAAFVLLFGRAAFGLLRRATGIRPQIVGVQEVFFGLITLVLILTGFSMDP